MIEEVPYEKHTPTIWIANHSFEFTHIILNHFRAMGYPVKELFITSGINGCPVYTVSNKFFEPGEMLIYATSITNPYPVPPTRAGFRWEYLSKKGDDTGDNPAFFEFGHVETPDDLERVIVKYFGLPKVKGRLIDA